MSDYKSYSDERLICLLNRGNHDAFSEIYNRYWLVIFRRFFKKLQSRELAEEYTQDLFASLWLKREQVAINVSLISYLNGAARNMVINFIRAEIRRKAMMKDVVEEAKVFEESNREIIDHLQSALQVLPHQTGDIIRMSKLEGLSVKEISAKKSMGNKAVEYHITKALKMLRQYLKTVKNAAAVLMLISVACG